MTLEHGFRLSRGDSRSAGPHDKVVTIETGNFPGLALEGKSITGSPFKSRAWGAVSFLLSSLVLLLAFSLRSPDG